MKAITMSQPPATSISVFRRLKTQNFIIKTIPPNSSRPKLKLDQAQTLKFNHKISTTLYASISSSSNESEPEIASEPNNARAVIVKLGEALSLGFPVWVASACLVALWKPSSFLWVGRTSQIVGITLTMLGMGMTLTLDDLKSAFLMPKELAAGFILQYTVMPLSGFCVSKLLNLPSYYAAGLILVSCCPGGTASNIVTYLARGNVALSVLMTATSTVTAAVMTPFLTSKLAGQFVAVDPVGLFMSTVQMIKLLGDRL